MMILFFSSIILDMQGVDKIKGRTAVVSLSLSYPSSDVYLGSNLFIGIVKVY